MQLRIYIPRHKTVAAAVADYAEATSNANYIMQSTWLAMEFAKNERL